MRSPRCAACRADDRSVAPMAALHIESRCGSLTVAHVMLLELVTRAVDGAKAGDA